ncbi:MAG: type II toxin-antitoxin system VapC family toxin [Methanobacteriota archaeon]|nr:MAG: type II toxin-antitoxin system VapC family toxin [Euryarchaeota archaeon]
MSYLLDTCVISEIIKPHPHPGVVEWLDSVDEEFLYLSALTVGEIQKGIAQISSSKKRKKLEVWLTHELLLRFQGRILPINEEVALTWGSLQGRLERKGTRMPSIDSLFAATAITYELILVTRNVKDFVYSEVELLNPWEENIK